MPRHLFGGSAADWIFEKNGSDIPVLQAGSVLTMWNAREGGSQITDITSDLAGSSPIGELLSTATAGGYRIGQIPLFYGPVDVTRLWVAADGGERIALLALDVGDQAVATRQVVDTHISQVNAHGTSVGDLADVSIPTPGSRTSGHVVTWSGSAFGLLAPSQVAGAALLNPPLVSGAYVGNIATPPATSQSEPWLQMRQPYSAPDTNADGIVLYGTHSNGTTPIKTSWFNGNNELRGAPSTVGRLAQQVFEFYEALGGPSTGRFWELSTNPALAGSREALLGAYGTGHATQPGWVVATRVLAGLLGVRAGGSYGGLTATNFRGMKTTPGAPTTGSWITGDMLLDSTGAVWLCTAGGSPGTWVSATGTPITPIVALYEYPSFAGSGWDTLGANYAEGGMVIANPASGAGGSTNADWEREIDAARAAGWKVLGYVTCDPTGLGGMDAGTQPIAIVKDDVDDWYAFYNVDGIFFDLTPTGIQVAGAPYVAEACDYVRTKGVAQTVVVNPGTYPLTADLVAPADVALVWEGDYVAQDYPNFTIPGYASWVNQFPPSKYLHLVYGATSAQMRTAAQKALALGAGNFYAADTNSAWTTLATYWTAEVPVLASLRPERDPLDRRNHRGALVTAAQQVTGARDDPESALASLLAALTNLGLVVDATTAT